MKKILLTILGVALIMASSCTESGIEDGAMNGNKIKLSTTQVEVGFEGETEFKVTVNSPCSWEAESKNDWLNVVTKQGVAGTKELLFYADDNYDLAKREGTIVVANRDYGYIDELYVTQKGFEPRIEYPETLIFNSDGGSLNANITANFSWSYTDDASWLSCSKTSSGLKVTATEWTSTKERTAEITLYSSNNKYNVEKIIKVTQKAFEPTLSVDKTELNFDVNGGSKTVYVTTNASAFSVSESSSWISYTKSGNSVKITASASDVTTERTAEVKIYLSDYNLSQTIKVAQKEFVPEFEVKVSEVEFEAESSSETISITANFDYSVSESVSWLSYEKTSNGVKLTATANVEERERTADVKIYNNTYGKSATVKVTQKKFAPELEVSVSELDFGTAGGTQTIPVTANFDYNVSENADWLSYQITSSGVELTATANVEEKDRTADITIHNNTYGKSATIKVIQAALIANCTIYYTSSNGKVVTPHKTDVFGANIGSNTYENGRGVIIFDAPVTSIGEDAFCYCYSLTSITIPDSVTSIGYEAFYHCTSLTSVTIGNSVTSIGDYAFSGCTSLTSVTIPDSVTSIGEHTFQSCTSLTSVTIPDSVTSIGWAAFSNCTSLTSVTIPSDITEIKDNTFQSCTSLTSITIPNCVTSIGGKAFQYCTSLTSITIPDRVTLIGYNAFQYCTSLTSVTIPNSVTKIGDYAFSSCTSLTSVTIPDSVTKIGYDAFCHCYSLTDVYCKPATPPAGDIDMFYDNALGRKIYVPTASVEAYKSASGWSRYASSIIGYDFE